MADETETTIPSKVGDLNAVVRVPDASTLLPGIVLVGGAGDSSCDAWGPWPEWISSTGAVVLRHDKPGCGGSPGDWRNQTIHDQAQESLAALQVLKRHPATEGQPVGLYGISQGGWVNLLAAAVAPQLVDFIVCHSGPFVSPAVQERSRIRQSIVNDGFDAAEISGALSWVDERLYRLLAGESPANVLESQNQLRDQRWFNHIAYDDYHNEAALRFWAGLAGFDPTSYFPSLACPVLAMFGGSDTEIPVAESIGALATHLPWDEHRNALALFPNADHLLFQVEPPRQGELAPGLLPTVSSFLTAL